MRALDLFCGAGGVSVGLERAGFEVTGVDIRDMTKYHRGGRFSQADALTFPLEGYDFICASPPCQRYSALRSLHKDRDYPDLIAAVRERLQAVGVPYCIENVPGAPLIGNLTLLCGTMFGLQTPDGRAEIRRHRVFETSFPIWPKPACQHGGAPESLTVCGTGLGPGNRGKEAAMAARRSLVLSVVGNHPEAKTGGLTATGGSSARELFSMRDARAAMQIDWMPMKYLSQAIPPAYSLFIGTQAMEHLRFTESATSASTCTPYPSTAGA